MIQCLITSLGQVAQSTARKHAASPVRPEVLITTVNSLSNYLYLEKYCKPVREPTILCSHSPICTFVCVYNTAFARVQLRVLYLHNDCTVCTFTGAYCLATVLLVNITFSFFSAATHVLLPKPELHHYSAA